MQRPTVSALLAIARFKSDPLAAFTFRAQRGSERKSSKRVRFESDYISKCLEIVYTRDLMWITMAVVVHITRDFGIFLVPAISNIPRTRFHMASVYPLWVRSHASINLFVCKVSNELWQTLDYSIFMWRLDLSLGARFSNTVCPILGSHWAVTRLRYIRITFSCTSLDPRIHGVRQSQSINRFAFVFYLVDYEQPQKNAWFDST